MQRCTKVELLNSRWLPVKIYHSAILRIGTITLYGPHIQKHRLTVVRVVDEAPHQEGVWGSGGINLCINVGRSGREKQTSHPGRFIPGERAHPPLSTEYKARFIGFIRFFS